MRQNYNVQEIGFALIGIGTILAVITIAFGLAYLVWLLAVPMRRSPSPAALVAAAPPRRMAPQRIRYTPRHTRQIPVPDETWREVLGKAANLPVPQDPWLHSAFTEIR